MEEKFETTEVQLNEIIVNDDIQQREEMNSDCVDNYAELIADGVTFPPVILCYDGERYLLVDGFHRVEAYKKARVERIPAEVFEGDERAAILYAVGSNSKHGLQRTRADKRKAALTLLMDDQWRRWSNSEIARQCGVSQPFVGNLRNELTQQGIESPQTRIGADGREIDTSNIGQSQNNVEPESSTSSSDDNSEGDQPNGSSEDSSIVETDDIDIQQDNSDAPDGASEDESPDGEQSNQSPEETSTAETGSTNVDASDGDENVHTDDTGSESAEADEPAHNSIDLDSEQPSDEMVDVEALKAENSRLIKLMQAKDDEIRICRNIIDELEQKIELLEKEMAEQEYVS